MKKRGPKQNVYNPANIGPLVHEDLNMADVEQSFVRGLRSAKQNLSRSLEDRVEEINRLLLDIGGFSAQIKSSFARSTVVFLEQEDPRYNFRERIIFSINLPNYELKRSWDKKSRSSKEKKTNQTDGRTSMQMTWDEAVNALSKIVEMTGLKPKYCKNDRHDHRFVMKQDLRSTDFIPDEYFSFTLDYNTEAKIEEMVFYYDQVVKEYNLRISKLENRLKKYLPSSQKKSYLELKKKYLHLCQDRDFFIGTTPDPHQLDEGLLFLIEVSTLKDYHIVKDRMQSMMTRYILYLSKIATAEAQDDTELQYQLSKTAHFAPNSETGKFQGLTEEEIKNIPQYSVDSKNIKIVRPPHAAVKKKKAA